MSFEKVLEEAEKTGMEVAELCSGLVQYNSAHPEGRTDECVAYIKAYLDRHGIENKTHANDPKKPNIVAKIQGLTGRRILWVGHLDVVPEGKPEGWTHPAYSGKITDDGRIYGRGTSDMKGACAAAMAAARILNGVAPLENTVEFWFTSDEEIGGIEGARWLSQSGRLKGDVCVIGDGNGGGLELPSVDLGCKGGAGTTLIARGKTAHGSTPYLGDNAISKLIKVIPWVEKIGYYELELPEELDSAIASSVEFYQKTQDLDTENKRKAAERLFNYPTVACNIINAGVKSNVVPDYAEARFDIRLTPGSKPLKVKERILELVQQAGVPGVEAEVRARETAGYYESPDSAFAHQLGATIEALTGKKPIFKILTGGTDAVSIKNYAGIPCLGYGTSLVGMAHQPDEHVTVENLVLGVKVYAGFPVLYKG
ncbi:MAG: M20/M25/M40 family metallo-hydrolase [Candidatus Bathyarchaeota archaeon]|nr:MAG: M20/M25/M40 family metallo-hydrolase [Candidatus Bathyarchaeota archaeon]